MTINVDNPDFSPLLMHLPEQTLERIKQAQSPVKQTFLLSPTPSEESLCTDSPVLPDFSKQDTLISLSTPSKPTSPVLASPNQNTTDKSVALQPAIGMDNILPDNMDLYTEDTPRTRRGNPAAPYSQQQPIVEQDIIMGPEVKGQLPIIRDHDFPYYPLPSYFPSPRHSTPIRPKPDWGNERIQVQGRGARGFGLRKFLRCAFRKYGVRRI